MLLAQPQVPSKINFGGLTLNINSSAKSKIQSDVDRIHKSPTYFKKMVKKANLYFPIIEKVFNEEGCPEEIKYLIIQESAINPDAVSSSNAVGYWQFKKATGQEVGLTIEGGIDERKNIERASRGAAKYINKNNARLDNYVYALTSYNTGLGGVQKYVKQKYLGANKMTIDGNTHWYFLKFLAHYIAYKDYVNKEKHELMLVVDENQSGKSIKQIARSKGLSLEDLDQYNRWIGSAKKIPSDKKYAVILPVTNDGRSTRETSKPVATNTSNQTHSHYNREVIDKQIDENMETDVHQNVEKLISSVKFDMNRIPAVRAGSKDNIATLARLSKRQLDQKKFLKINDMRKFDQVTTGQVYYLKKKSSKARLASFHVVKKNESLWEISQYYGIKLKSLKRKNHLKRKQSYVKEGMVLWLRDTRPSEIPVEYRKLNKPVEVVKEDEPKPEVKEEVVVKELVSVEHVKQEPVVAEAIQDEEEGSVSTPKNQSTAPHISHIVKPGETLYSISRKYDVKVDDIKAWNKLTSVVLSTGQELTIGEAEPVEVGKTEEKIDSTNNQPEDRRLYKVEAGDTLYGISKKFGISVDDIKRWNKLSTNGLSVGMDLIVSP